MAGTDSSAVAVLRMDTCVYLSIVSVIVECLARTCAFFGCTPAWTNRVMDVCRNARKSANSPASLTCGIPAAARSARIILAELLGTSTTAFHEASPASRSQVGRASTCSHPVPALH